MTKQSELAILDKAIAELTMASYVGPWLTAVRAEVEQNMTADFQPHMMPHEARNEALRIIAVANERAAELVQFATVKAERITESAKRDALVLRTNAVNALGQAAAAIRDAAAMAVR